MTRGKLAPMQQGAAQQPTHWGQLSSFVLEVRVFVSAVMLMTDCMLAAWSLVASLPRFTLFD